MKRTLASLTAGAMLATIAAARADVPVSAGTAPPAARPGTIGLPERDDRPVGARNLDVLMHP